MGRGWDESKWTSPTLPSRQDMDSVTAGHPAYLIRIDGHSGVANTAALDGRPLPEPEEGGAGIIQGVPVGSLAPRASATFAAQQADLETSRRSRSRARGDSGIDHVRARRRRQQICSASHACKRSVPHGQPERVSATGSRARKSQALAFAHPELSPAIAVMEKRAIVSW